MAEEQEEIKGVTQADRDAAASGYFAWCSGNPVIPERMKAGDADDHSMVQAFARHRIKTEQKIVEWLRGDVADDNIHSCDQAADAIEAGAYLK